MKISRNDKCPCGSGKKYKKCCLPENVSNLIADDAAQDDLIRFRKVKEIMQNMLKEYWKNWLDGPIPMLNNQTPREAATTKKGRELLETLLLEYAYRDSVRDPANPFKADIAVLRAELGLDEK